MKYQTSQDSWLEKRYGEFFAAMSLMTRLPLPNPAERSEIAVQGRSVWAYPLAGLVVGILSALALALCAAFALPPMIGASAAVLTGIFVTGALHEDGLADFADGFGGRNPRARLRIMRDSALGTYGALALIFTLVARTAILAALAPLPAVAALIGAHILARGALVLPMRHHLPARRDGIAARAGSPSNIRVVFSLIGAILLALLVVDPRAVPFAAIAAVLVVMTVAGFAKRRIGGYTGDVLGACEQAAEIAVLCVVAAFMG